MKGHSLWSYHPYRPLGRSGEEIYICRIAPGKDTVCVEWLDPERAACSVLYRRRGEGEFIRAGVTQDRVFDIRGLESDQDYEICVTAGEKRSAVRLARTGETVGTVVNYLHPEDPAYSFSGKYLCSPSLVRHPDGYLLASMDVYASGHPQNLTLIYRSDDDGATWHYVSELMPCFWGKLLVHRGRLYMLGCSTEYGDLLIGASDDGGKTFGTPVTLIRGSNGKNGDVGVHKNPQNMILYGGRLYGTLEWGSWANREYGHAAMVMSCDENADLLDPENWHFTEPVKFSRFAPELEGLPDATMTIEGTLVTDPQGRLLNIMRFGKPGNAIVYQVDARDHDAPLTYSRCMEFPANYSKFMIRYDGVSGYYYTVATRVYDPCLSKARNLLSLMRSADLVSWEVVTDLFDRRGDDPDLVGFQYVYFRIEENDIIYLCRTALNGAHNYHDSNYSTFHRIEDFRNILPEGGQDR